MKQSEKGAGFGVEVGGSVFRSGRIGDAGAMTFRIGCAFFPCGRCFLCWECCQEYEPPDWHSFCCCGRGLLSQVAYP